jgi:hypothetical protein
VRTAESDDEGAAVVEERGAAGDVVVDDEALAVAHERELARAQSRRRAAERRRATWGHMVVALLVVLGIVVALLLLVPASNPVTQPPVDVAAGARVAATRVDFVPSVPSGLPAGWRATSVRTVRATASVMTWHAGYMTTDDQYAAVEQGQDVPLEWLRSQTNRGREDGTQDVAGVAWRRFVRAPKVQNSLVHERDGVTTVVTGTAGFEELAVLAAALEPAG